MPIPETNSTPAKAALYVGDLHPSVTEGQLQDAFAEFKTLSSVRVCRNASSGKSLGYGYVNFETQEDAIRAIEVKNNTELNGKVIRVMWSHRDPNARKSGIGNLFVKNLSDSIDNVALQEAFQKFGKVLSCKVAVYEDGKSKGYGFVQFENEEPAKASIEKLNGSIFEGKQIYVAKFVKRSERALPMPDAKYTNLYIKNLDQDVTEEHLREKLSEFGKIASVVILKDDNGTSKGFGFVNFENPNDAKRAIEALHGSQLGSKNLYVDRAQKKSEREQILRRQFEEKQKEQSLKFRGLNVYVKNIHDDVSDDELHGLFSQCGTISSAKVMRDDKGISKGFGFICFSNTNEASKAVDTLRGYMFHDKPLYVAFAQRKEERKEQLQQQFAQRRTSVVAPKSAVVAPEYQPLYFTGHHGVVSPLPSCPTPTMVYGAAGWTIAPTGRPYFQPSPVPVVQMHNTPRQQLQQNNGKMMWQQNSHGSDQFVSSTTPQMQQYSRTATRSKFGGIRYQWDPVGTSTPANGTKQYHETVRVTPQEQQKQMIGEQLYARVRQLNPEHCAKITGMLLEMDNTQLTKLLHSHEALAAKVEEAVQVLNLSRAKLSSQESIQLNSHSSHVAVN